MNWIVVRDRHIPCWLGEETHNHRYECCHDNQEDEEGGTGKHPGSDEADAETEEEDDRGVQKWPPKVDRKSALSVNEKCSCENKINVNQSLWFRSKYRVPDKII